MRPKIEHSRSGAGSENDTFGPVGKKSLLLPILRETSPPNARNIRFSIYLFTQIKSLYHACVEKIPLQDVEVEEFRKVKNFDWLVTHKDHGIKKTHIWIKETCHDKVHCYTAKTADRPLIEVKIMKQKKKGSYKNRKSKRQ